MTDTTDDTPCGWCGHPYYIHNDGCLDGWDAVDGLIVEGPDGCACVGWQEPT